LPFEDDLRRLHGDDPAILADRNIEITDRVFNRVIDQGEGGTKISNGMIDDTISTIISEAGLQLDMSNPEHVALVKDIRKRLQSRALEMRSAKEKQAKMEDLQYQSADDLAQRYSDGTLSNEDLEFLKKADPEKYQQVVAKDIEKFSTSIKN